MGNKKPVPSMEMGNITHQSRRRGDEKQAAGKEATASREGEVNGGTR